MNRKNVIKALAENLRAASVSAKLGGLALA